MASSQGVNVLRYSALLFGAFYGFSHQRQLNATARATHEHHEFQHKEDLIKQAKKAYQNKLNPPKGDGVIMDPDDKNFDLDKALNKLMGD